MNLRNEGLIKRYAAHPLRREVAYALEVAEKFAEGRAAIDRDVHLSPEGRTAKKGALVRSALRDIRDAGAPQIAEMKQKLASIVALIKPVSFAKDDLAGAMLRSELRTALRGMSLSEKAAALTGEKAVAEFVDAALEAPPLLSGIEQGMFEQVREQRLATLFTQESFQVEALTDQIAEAESALTIARQDIARASDLRDYEFTKLATEISAKKNAPWLKRDRDSNGNEIVIVVPVRGGPSRPATADEIRDGQFFSSLSEYEAARSAA
jgi:hypothetical protein